MGHEARKSITVTLRPARCCVYDVCIIIIPRIFHLFVLLVYTYTLSSLQVAFEFEPFSNDYYSHSLHFELFFHSRLSLLSNGHYLSFMISSHYTARSTKHWTHKKFTPFASHRRFLLTYLVCKAQGKKHCEKLITAESFDLITWNNCHHSRQSHWSTSSAATHSLLLISATRIDPKNTWPAEADEKIFIASPSHTENKIANTSAYPAVVSDCCWLLQWLLF